MKSNLINYRHVEAEAIYEATEGRRLEEVQWIGHHDLDELLVEVSPRMASC